MHILIAPNAFKNSLDAGDVAEAIVCGLRQSVLECTCECFPVGDGGDGTGKLLTERRGGTFAFAEVHDPLGRKIRVPFGLIDNGKTAVIEMADASGLRLLKADELSPLKASSRGTGELIRHALDQGVTRVIIALGGSATVDGGAGMLHALGVRFLNAAGYGLSPFPEGLKDLDRVDSSSLDARVRDTEFIVVCDVVNTLLGQQGAAAVFGPQKGATAQDVAFLDASLRKMCNAVRTLSGKDMSSVGRGGAAGGAAAGLYALLDAQLVNGIDFFLDITGFDQALDKADIVITAEGSIDRQTLEGKGPFGVACRAKAKQLPVVGLAGKVPLEEDAKLRKYFDVLTAIGNGPADLSVALLHTRDNLIRTSEQIGNLLAIGRITNKSNGVAV